MGRISVRAYIGLGANLGEPAAQIGSALVRIGATPGIDLVTSSRRYRSEPIGPAGQPDYCNAACIVDTVLAPLQLLEALHAIENAAGRERGGERWSARTLDLDILHIEGVTCDTPQLQLPHPQLAQRAFVLVPLAEIACDLVIPELGRMDELAAAIDRRGLSEWP